MIHCSCERRRCFCPAMNGDQFSRKETGQRCGRITAFVAWVGATCARWTPPVSCLGESHLSAQRLHLSAQPKAAGEVSGADWHVDWRPLILFSYDCPLSGDSQFGGSTPASPRDRSAPNADDDLSRLGAWPKLEPLIDSGRAAAYVGRERVGRGANKGCRLFAKVCRKWG